MDKTLNLLKKGGGFFSGAQGFSDHRDHNFDINVIIWT